jgi:hypothetical protein
MLIPFFFICGVISIVSFVGTLIIYRRNNCKRTRISLLIFACMFLVGAVLISINVSQAIGGSAEKHSSPSFPVDAFVWGKLEQATPMYKACASTDTSSLQQRLNVGECSAIVLKGGQFRLVNWTFPMDLDFSKTGSIAMEDSTDIVHNLDARFGGGYVLDLDRAGQARSDALDGRAAESQSTGDTAKLIKKAASGDAEAQATLGSMYDNGQGVVNDDAEAVRWYRKAAEQGHAGAQNNLGLMYLSGRGVTKDEKEAYFWTNLGAPTLGAQAESNRDRVGMKLTSDERTQIQERCRKWAGKHSRGTTVAQEQVAPETRTPATVSDFPSRDATIASQVKRWPEVSVLGFKAGESAKQALAHAVALGMVRAGEWKERKDGRTVHPEYVDCSFIGKGGESLEVSLYRGQLQRLDYSFPSGRYDAVVLEIEKSFGKPHVWTYRSQIWGGMTPFSVEILRTVDGKDGVLVAVFSETP